MRLALSSTMTEEEAYDIYRLLIKRGVDAAYVDRDSSAFKRGLTVTTFYLAKGTGIRSGIYDTRNKGKSASRTGGVYQCHQSASGTVCVRGGVRP